MRTILVGLAQLLLRLVLTALWGALRLCELLLGALAGGVDYLLKTWFKH